MQNLNYLDKKIKEIRFLDKGRMDNGILTQLTNKVSKKLIGFIQFEVEAEDGESLPMLVKSKALGDEVLDGLHFMASNVSVELADKLLAYKNKLEYGKSHLTEIAVYEALKANNYAFMPTLYGTVQNKEREIYLLLTEQLKEENQNLVKYSFQNDPHYSCSLMCSTEIIKKIICLSFQIFLVHHLYLCQRN